MKDEDSEICTTSEGMKCSKNEEIPDLADKSFTVRTDYCMEIDFKPNQCENSTFNFTNHFEYECAIMDDRTCNFYKHCTWPCEDGNQTILASQVPNI